LQDPLNRKSPNSYLAYGLQLVSDSPIAGLIPLESPRWKFPQISVRFHADEPKNGGDEALWYTSDIPDENGNPALKIWKNKASGGYRIHYSHGLEFYVDRDASSILVHCCDEPAKADAAEFLLGPVLGIVLRLRGFTCLHASAVAVGEEAIAFAGPEGAGKSTTAAMFVEEGHAALADDVVTLVERGSCFEVPAGCAYLNLWPESLEMLRGTDQPAPADKPSADKRQWALSAECGKFLGESLSLGAIYLLGERSRGPNANRIENLSPKEALMGLIANTYANKLLDPEMRAREFELLGRLVKHVRVRRVTPHEDASRLRELHEVILQDMATAQKSAAAAPALR
jgi:hypothetical protein